MEVKQFFFSNFPPCWVNWKIRGRVYFTQIGVVSTLQKKKTLPNYRYLPSAAQNYLIIMLIYAHFLEKNGIFSPSTDNATVINIRRVECGAYVFTEKNRETSRKCSTAAQTSQQAQIRHLVLRHPVLTTLTALNMHQIMVISLNSTSNWHSQKWLTFPFPGSAC